MKIERIGITGGRWPRYMLVVDGVNIGTVRRTTAGSSDRMSPHARYDAWRIHGMELETREAAERELIARAVRFGHLNPGRTR